MTLCWWHTPQIRNFGDELNPVIWPQLIPRVIKSKQCMFLGIGTLLQDGMTYPKDVHKIVFGCGVGYGMRPVEIDHRWKFYCVRGPMSADALGLSRDLALTDSAVLIRRLFKSGPGEKTHGFGFIPHHQSAALAGNNWDELCSRLGMRYIDPCGAVDDVLQAIASVDVVIAEAMHGAIVADALRVPWIPVITGQHIQQFKWLDWCASLEMDYKPVYLPPLFSALRTPANSAQRPYENLLEQVENSMRLVTKQQQWLSKESHLENLTQRMEETLQQLRNDFSRGFFTS